MKYRALKDFVGYNGHFFKAGEVVDYGYIDPRYVPLQNLIASLLKFGFIEEIKDEPWEPKKGDKYWVVCENGVVDYTYADGETGTKSRVAIGNCFQTKEQAEKAVKWLKAFKVLRDDTKGFRPDWNNQDELKWVVGWDLTSYKLDVTSTRGWSSSLLHFRKDADAWESIKKHQDYWLTFLGIEEE